MRALFKVKPGDDEAETGALMVAEFFIEFHSLIRGLSGGADPLGPPPREERKRRA